ncbi:MAG: multicopper oxidase family protein [Candidatus Dormibacteraeota bacterium]|nr:multicopper oxidase family protein [Candidatus Dormibacteraeota bacterium]
MTVRLTRREALRLGGGAALALPLLPLASACGSSTGSTGSMVSSGAKLPRPFAVPLPVPQVLQPTQRDATTDYYEVVQRAASVEILPGLRTEVWGYNGTFPGPTIEARSGRRVVVRHHNQLPVPTVVHLHGGVTPPDSDGYPTDLILPAEGAADVAQVKRNADNPAWSFQTEAKDYAYPLDQRAATLWYHDHRMDFTGPQVYRGLAGFFVVRDAEEDSLPLPKGEREIPLLICDRAFGSDGSFHYPALDPSLKNRPGVTNQFMEGVLGDVILVNGAPWPFLEVAAARYRFRILNASNARRYRLALDPPPKHGSPFVQIGSDQGLLAQPVAQQAIEIAQAERFDVVVDFSAYPTGTKVTLTNEFDSGSTGRVMRFHVTHSAGDESTVPPRLSEGVEELSRSAATATRTFDFDRSNGMWMIDGQPFDPARMDARPKLEATEIWRLSTDQHHPIHLHLVHFQVLTRNRGKPGPYDAGWKDVIDLSNGDEAEIIARFSGYRGRYVFHCHNLEHEDMAMMGNFQVV